MWDERYSAEHYVYGTEPNQFLEQRVASLPRGDVLCLAEGEGRNAVFLARRGYRVTAVDASSVGGAPELMMSAAQLRDELTGLHIEHLQELERDVIEAPSTPAVRQWCSSSPSGHGRSAAAWGLTYEDSRRATPSARR